jgi:methyl coenzyme M reductase subunit C-like uncharacterized protein (methanogenesis marker protein 7)
MDKKDKIEETLKKIKNISIIAGVVLALSGLGVAIYYIKFKK